MKFWKIVSLLLFAGIIVSGGLGYVLYHTFKYQGKNAVARMTEEDRRWLIVVDGISSDMTRDEIFHILGEPDQDLLLLAKWRGFGGSPFSELRIYFSSGRPYRLRWIKLGSFLYQKKTGRIIEVQLR